MKVDKKTVEKIAGLARLEIREEQVETIGLEMEKILTFMEKLNELDTTGVEPLIYMNEDVNRWRPDEVKQELTLEEAMQNAPAHNGSYFLVPKVVEK